MKQLEVSIMGQSYLLGCPEGGEVRLLSAVGKVDGAMCQIRDAGKVKARDRIAVLAALNLAFQLDDDASAAQQRNQTSPSAGSGEAGAQALDDDPRLDALIERLDQALGDDGRLL